MNSNLALSPSRCVRSAWELTGKAPAAIWVAGLVLALVEGAPSAAWDYHGTFGVEWDPQNGPFNWVRALFLWPMMTLVGLALSAVTAWLRCGYFLGLRRVMKTGTAELGEMYNAEGKWLSFFLTELLRAVLIGLAGIPCYLLALGFDGDGVGSAIMLVVALAYVPVWIYVMLGLSWMTQTVAFHGRSPLDSINASWELAAGNRWKIFILSLVSALLIFLGLFLCCVGVIAAAIVMEVMWVEAYLQLTSGPDGFEAEHQPHEPAPAPDAFFPTDRPTAPITTPATASEPPAVNDEASAPEPTPEPEPTTPEPERREGDTDSGGGPFDPAAWRQGPDIPPIEPEQES